MTKHIKRIAVTGAAGHLAHHLLFWLADGDLFGPDQPIALHLLELPDAMPMLEGGVMELQDCAFPLLHEIHIGSDPYKVFQDVDVAFLIGAKPRGPGMERKDLLNENGAIFTVQGKALNAVAKRSVRVVVVGNPCNTNCLIAMHAAPDISPSHFSAMMRLDHNRATGFLAERAQVSVADVQRVTIWGNHSATQVPDFMNATIRGKPASQVIGDIDWLEGDFCKAVQGRGAQIIAKRGKSSAASAACAAIDAMRDLFHATPSSTWFSSAVLSNGNPYGIANDLIFSFPCISKGAGDHAIVPGLQWDAFLQKKIALTEKELLEERDAVAHLLRR